MLCIICCYVWAFTWCPCHMDSNPSPPRSKAEEMDAKGHSNASNPVKVGQIYKATKPG